MHFKSLSIPDVILVTPKRHSDERGYFVETFRENAYERAGIQGPFVQDNFAFSKPKHVLRGLHFQTGSSAQGKLVSCLQGEILDVAVDIRQGSPQFGQVVTARLSGENGQQLFVPAGFAHGYVTLAPDCYVQYKVTSYYDPQSEAALAWNDPDLAIDWQLGGAKPILSEKDQKNPPLNDLPDYFIFTP